MCTFFLGSNYCFAQGNENQKLFKTNKESVVVKSDTMSLDKHKSLILLLTKPRAK